MDRNDRRAMTRLVQRVIRVACVGVVVLGVAACSGSPTPARGLGIEDVSGTWILEGESDPAAMELHSDRTVEAHDWPSDIVCNEDAGVERLDVTGTWIGAYGGRDNAIYLMLDGPCGTHTGFLFQSNDDVLEMQFFPPGELDTSYEPLWVLRRE